MTHDTTTNNNSRITIPSPQLTKQKEQALELLSTTSSQTPENNNKYSISNYYPSNSISSLIRTTNLKTSALDAVIAKAMNADLSLVETCKQREHPRT